MILRVSVLEDVSDERGIRARFKPHLKSKNGYLRSSVLYRFFKIIAKYRLGM